MEALRKQIFEHSFQSYVVRVKLNSYIFMPNTNNTI